MKREIESLLVAAQNNAIKTNYVKAKIDNMQENNKCRLSSDRNETINHLIRECSLTRTKGMRELALIVGKGYSLGIVQ